ncbi:hypothetical protein [Vibrio sp. HN007]|uniref:hypothetical protein n=1 Tax=Vibrio iocasae TaxID=3098914 RepID=UPI0035D4AE4A
MAAERLTKQRLVHILIMMIVLITAFFWRTFVHFQTVVDCTPQKACISHIDGHQLEFIWNEDLKEYKSKVSGDLKLNVELTKGEGLLMQQQGSLTILLQSNMAQLKIKDENTAESIIVNLNQ